MRLRLIGLAVLLLFPSQLQARVVKREGKALSVLISTDRLTRIEFPEPLRSAFLSRSDISIEKEDRSLYLRALLPDTQDTLFVVGESGTTYEINLSTSWGSLGKRYCLVFYASGLEAVESLPCCQRVRALLS